VFSLDYLAPATVPGAIVTLANVELGQAAG
jgi:hypothetical protein